MVGVIIILVVAVFIILVLRSGKNIVPDIPEIHKVLSIEDLVACVNHGRIYPFYTRMNLVRAKDAAMKIVLNPVEFKQNVQFQELIGIAPFFDIPISNKYVERVSVHLNKRGLVSSVGIDLKDFHLNMKPLVEEMVIKFGRPTSMNDEFIIWREACMVINICINGSLSIIDESLF